MTARPNRRFLLLGAAAGALSACARPPAVTKEGPAAQGPSERRFAASPERALTDDQWRARLSPAAYAVLRQEDTERPGSSPLNAEKRDGTYVCAGCALPLFRSAWKYESGTGWPSFFEVIDSNIGKKTDRLLFVPRTEYHCARCLGHQGHVFDDGPAPTGLRYCNNGVALHFEPTPA
jgi:peptide-methionine (R)-S-oxide reductase